MAVLPTRCLVARQLLSSKPIERYLWPEEDHASIIVHIAARRAPDKNFQTRVARMDV